jgi:hypothetical protein
MCSVEKSNREAGKGCGDKQLGTAWTVAQSSDTLWSMQCLLHTKADREGSESKHRQCTFLGQIITAHHTSYGLHHKQRRVWWALRAHSREEALSTMVGGEGVGPRWILSTLKSKPYQLIKRQYLWKTNVLRKTLNKVRMATGENRKEARSTNLHVRGLDLIVYITGTQDTWRGRTWLKLTPNMWPSREKNALLEHGGRLEGGALELSRVWHRALTRAVRWKDRWKVLREC